MFDLFTIELSAIRIASILIALTFHEAAHAFMAMGLGDMTQKTEGRLSLNPIKHIDPLGFLMIIFFGFGWAKPVRINVEQLKKPERDIILIALAGPLSNLLIALIGFTVLMIFYPVFCIPGTVPVLLKYFLYVLPLINLMLFVFNLIPLPPLDGSAVLLNAIPNNQINLKIAAVRFGPWILLAIVILDFYTSFKLISPIIHNLSEVLFKLFRINPNLMLVQ